jgi:hypothetical protein
LPHHGGWVAVFWGEEVVAVFDAEVELDPADGAREGASGFVVGDSESGVCSNVHAVVSREDEWLCSVYSSLADSFAIDVEGDIATLGESLAVVCELDADLVLTCGCRGLPIR